MRFLILLVLTCFVACSSATDQTDGISDSGVVSGDAATSDLGGISTGNPESDGGVITGNPELTLPFPDSFLPELPLPEESLIDALSEATDVLHPYLDGASEADGSGDVGSRDFFTAVKMPSQDYAAVFAQFNAVFQLIKTATPEVTSAYQSVTVDSDLPVSSSSYLVEHALVEETDDTAQFLFKDATSGSVFGSAKIKIDDERFIKGHLVLVSRSADAASCETTQLFGCLTFLEMAFDAQDETNLGYVIRYQLESRHESGHLHLQCDQVAQACISETPHIDAHPSEIAFADAIFRSYMVLGDELSFCAERVSYEAGLASLSGIVFSNDASCAVPVPAWGSHVYETAELPLRIGDDASAPNGEKSSYESLSEDAWRAVTDLDAVSGKLDASGY